MESGEGIHPPAAFSFRWMNYYYFFLNTQIFHDISSSFFNIFQWILRSFISKVAMNQTAPAFRRGPVHGFCGAWGVLAAAFFDWGKVGGPGSYQGMVGGLRGPSNYIIPYNNHGISMLIYIYIIVTLSIYIYVLSILPSNWNIYVNLCYIPSGYD